MKIAFVIAGLTLAASTQVNASEHYQLKTAADLARLCTTAPSAGDHATAVSFCHGVLAGAYGFYLSATPPEDRFVCSPNPAPSRTQVANGFVAWLKARPQYSNEGAIDALFRYAAETYPCKR
jgi:hypothetical protein